MSGLCPTGDFGKEANVRQGYTNEKPSVVASFAPASPAATLSAEKPPKTEIPPESIPLSQRFKEG